MNDNMYSPFSSPSISDSLDDDNRAAQSSTSKRSAGADSDDFSFYEAFFGGGGDGNVAKRRRVVDNAEPIPLSSIAALPTGFGQEQNLTSNMLYQNLDLSSLGEVRFPSSKSSTGVQSQQTHQKHQQPMPIDILSTMKPSSSQDNDPFSPLPITAKPSVSHDSLASFMRENLSMMPPATETPPPSAVVAAALLLNKDARKELPAPTVNSDKQAKKKSAVPRKPKKITRRSSSTESDVSNLLPHYSDREIQPLATNEDSNWLSDFLSFVRSDVVEVFQATTKDVENRSNSKKIVPGQVGIRCRFCAHLPRTERVRRAACYPSSTKKIYQSFTMMIRDHLCHCTAMPEDVKAKYVSLKDQATQGAADSKRYWASSATELGMVDSSDERIIVMKDPENVRNSNSDADVRPADSLPVLPQGAVLSSDFAMAALPDLSVDLSNSQNNHHALLFDHSDQTIASPYTFLLVQQVKRVFLTQDEIIGNRRSLPMGLPGFGCNYCDAAGRKGGKCRLFPARRRTLAGKLQDLHEHLIKCPLCPAETKQELENLKQQHRDRKSVV